MSAAPQPNPLLSRGKLKKPATKSKSKAKGKQQQPANATAAPSVANGVLATTSMQQDAPGFPDTTDDNEVDDLADQLLSQLDAQADVRQPPAATDPSQTRSSSLSVPPAQADVHKSSSGTSLASSSSTAREKLHDFKEGVKDILLPNSRAGSPTNVPAEKMSRQKARKLKKEQHYENVRRQAEEETLAENDRSVQDEKDAILAGCTKLKVRIKEINPDGHCLYSAIADQVNVKGLSGRKEDYSTVRSHAAEFMRAHPDDFLPFLTSEVNDDEMMSPKEYARYCDTVEKTAEWGGEPEINALSKFYQAPIHVLQAGTDLVKVGEDLPADRGPILISYHRKMYGLGEHYNSLRPATYGGPH